MKTVMFNSWGSSRRGRVHDREALEAGAVEPVVARQQAIRLAKGVRANQDRYEFSLLMSIRNIHVVPGASIGWLNTN
jgi:hypothetical protein